MITKAQSAIYVMRLVPAMNEVEIPNVISIKEMMTELMTEYSNPEYPVCGYLGGGVCLNKSLRFFKGLQTGHIYARCGKHDVCLGAEIMYEDYVAHEVMES